MTASTPGGYLLEQVDRRTVLLARVATFTDRKKIEDMPGGLVEDKARVAVGPNKNNNEEKNRDQYQLRKEKVMKVGFAVQTNEGIESKVYDHFGSAPAFIIVDTEGKEVLTVNNKDLHHVHGACNPIMALDGKAVNAMIVGGIGAGALTKLNALGIKVYGAGASSVKENLSLLSENKLQELSVNNSCRSHQGGCGH
jgi:ArsR family transcriptional regulator